MTSPNVTPIESIPSPPLLSVLTLVKSSVYINTGAVELLVSIGFNEELVSDEAGKTETYLVLKRNDPGLLWLAKSFVEQNNTP